MPQTTGREYSIAEKCAAVFAADMKGVGAVSRELDIPSRTIRSWQTDESRDALGIGKDAALSVVKERFEQEVSGIFEDCLSIIEKANKQVIAKVGDASAAQAATIAGIYIDKANILLGLTGGKSESKETMTDAQKAQLILDAAEVISKGNAIEVKCEVIECD